MRKSRFFQITAPLGIAILFMAMPLSASCAQDVISSPASILDMDPSVAAPLIPQQGAQEKPKIAVAKFPIKMKVKTNIPDPKIQKAAIEKRAKFPPKKPQPAPAHAPDPVKIAAPAVAPPVPARRPNIQMASPEFVEKARKTMVDTYTVVKHEGSPMPALPSRDVTSESLAPARLSVADIAHDPLASQIVNLSPEELALAMNGIRPSSGIVAKPRIVRQEGERIYRSRKIRPESGISPDGSPSQSPSLAGTTIPVSLAPPIERTEREPSSLPSAATGLRFMVPFGPGETALSIGDESRMDRELIRSLKVHNDHRLQIVSWASPTDGKETSARRIALARALSIRAYLIGKGFDASRMDIRAMGVQTDSNADPDQVEMILVPEKS